MGKENIIVADVKIKNLNEYLELFKQLQDIIEKINELDLKIEISQFLHMD